MPQVIAAAAAAVTWVTTTAAVAASTASFYLASVTGLSWVTASAVVAAGAQLALSAATTALMTPNIGRGGSPLSFKADPSAPISGVMGRFGVGGRQLHANVWGKDNLYLSFAVALSLGPIQSVESFTANGTEVTFPNAQGLTVPVGTYKDKMWQTYRLGLPTDAYLSPPTGVSDGSPAMTEWTSAHTLPGFAQTFWTMKNNSKGAGYQSGVPTPLWTLLGMKVWDPRLDSTYPGGSGSQRRTDWTTWAYTDNPYLHALAWVRGHHKLASGGTIDLTKRVAGVGAPDAAIDIAAFVEGANVADANSWAISGEWTTADDKWQTLAAMLQAGGGVPISQGAQISCMVETPRTSLMTVTGADIVGSVSLNVMASRRDRPNTVIPRVRLEAHKFEEVALGAVTSATYVTEDGGESRVIETAYSFVGLAKQAAELAGYGLANTRETLKASIPCKPYLLGLRAGDAFIVTEPELGLSGQKFVVQRRSFDPSSSIVTLDVRSETDAKHAWALGRSADAPASPSLTAPDPVPTTPATEDWTVTPRPVESSGVRQPGLVVTGSAVGENIGEVLIEYGLTAEGPWEQAYSGPPTIETVAINGLEGGEDYYVAVTLWSLRGVPSAQLVKGPYTAPDLTAGDVVVIGGRPVVDLVPEWRELPALIRERELAAENNLRETLDRHSRIQAEEQARIDGDIAEATARAADLMAEAAARGTAIAGVEDSIDIVATDLAAEVTTRTAQYAATVASVASVSSSVTTVANDLSALTTSVTTQFSAVNSTLAIHTTSISTNATAIAAETSSRTSAISTINGTLASHTTSITTNATAIAAETTARTSAISTLTAADVTITARIATEETTRASADTALSSRSTTLEAQMADTATSGLRSRIATEETTRASAVSAETTARTSAISTLTAADVTINARIDTETATRVSAIAAETSARTTAISAINGTLAGHTTSIATNATAIAAETTNRTAAISTLTTANTTTNARIDSEITTRAAADTAETSARTAAISTLTAADVTINARIDTETATRVSAIAAETSARTTAISTINGTLAGHTTSIATNATAIAAETTNRTAAISAINGTLASQATSITTNATAIAAETTNRTAAISTLTTANTTTNARIDSEITTRAAADTALATRASALEVTINTAGTGVSARLAVTESVAISAQGTANAIYGVTLDVNGNISGFSSVNNGVSSTFDVKADIFRLSNGATNLTPFSVDTVAGKIDMNADVRINGSLAVSGSFQTASLATDAITKHNNSYTDGSITINHAGETLIQTVTLTTTGGRVVVDVNFFLDYWHPAGGNASIVIRVVRDYLTTIFDETFDAIGGDYLFGWQAFNIVDAPAAGTIVYEVWAQIDVSNATNKIAKCRFLGATEFKR